MNRKYFSYIVRSHIEKTHNYECYIHFTFNFTPNTTGNMHYNQQTYHRFATIQAVNSITAILLIFYRSDLLRTQVRIKI